MRNLGNFFIGVAGLLFACAVACVVAFLAGGIDAIAEGEPGALMAWVGLAIGIAGLLAYVAGNGLREKSRR